MVLHDFSPSIVSRFFSDSNFYNLAKKIMIKQIRKNEAECNNCRVYSLNFEGPVKHKYKKTC